MPVATDSPTGAANSKTPAPLPETGLVDCRTETTSLEPLAGLDQVRIH